MNVSIDRRDLVSASLSAGVALAATSVTAQPVKPPPRLSVFVLDTHRGRPATGLKVDFSAKDPAGYKFVKTVTINATGNTDEPVFKAAEMAVGDYEFNLHVADYFRGLGVKLPSRPFLNEVPIRFSVFDVDQVFHVPVLLTPWSYITYRGS
jgi:5-hydroxyisourate hydrolase